MHISNLDTVEAGQSLSSLQDTAGCSLLSSAKNKKEATCLRTLWWMKMAQTQNLCLFNQRGFCKFVLRCTSIHGKQTRLKEKECTDQKCSERHPRDCRYFCKDGQCKFGENRKHSQAEDYRNTKLKTLEKEVLLHSFHSFLLLGHLKWKWWQRWTRSSKC